MNNRVYRVLEHKNYSGLTIGSRSIEAGKTFLGSQWNFGEKALKIAIDEKRCIEITDSKTREKLSRKDMPENDQVKALESRLDDLEKIFSEKEDLLQKSNKLLVVLLQAYQRVSQNYIELLRDNSDGMDEKSKEFKEIVKQSQDFSEESELIISDIDSFLGVDNESK